MSRPVALLGVVAHLFMALAQAVGWLLLWIALSVALLHLHERLTAQHYAPGDTPHHAFQILALTESGTPGLRFLRDHQRGMPLVTQVPLKDRLSGRQGEHFYSFTQTEPGVYELHADRDTFISTQRYRIEGQGADARISPLSFRSRNVAQGFIAFLLALPLLWGLSRLARVGDCPLLHRVTKRKK